MSQQYSLRWNNHQPNFISMFTTLLNSQTLVDVTLAAEGKHLLAHKVVLSACSTYFQALFIDNPSRHPIVILKDVTFANLRTIVDFMYCGEVNVTQESLTQVLDTAKLLKIKGLTDMPPDSTLSTVPRSQNDFNETTERHSASPATSTESRKRKRSRKSSTGSTHLNMVPDETEEPGPLDVMRSDSITLSSVPQRRTVENAQQTNTDQHNLVDVPMMDGSAGVPQGGQWSMVEHTYPRYTNACLGGTALQPDAALYMNNVMNPHMNAELGEYGPLGVPGPSPGPSCVPDAPHAEPPPPAPAKRRRTSNPQSEENFQRALEAVRFGGIGFCKAARMFGVNNRTLWLEYKKKGYPNNRPSIRSRIKRENTTPPREPKEDGVQTDQQMALLCPTQGVPVSFIDSRPLDFPGLQGVHNSPLNILGVNFNAMQ